MMLLDLSPVLSEQHTTLNETVDSSLEFFQSKMGKFPVMEKEPFHLTAAHVEGQKYQIRLTGRITLGIPCDRCLENVPTVFAIDSEREVEIDGSEQKEGNYIDGYMLDADQMICEEILIGWPTKILCSEDCKGICNVCGQNLNQGTCNCEDTGLDPRMSVIRDVFKNFKEV